MTDPLVIVVDVTDAEAKLAELRERIDALASS